MAGPLHAAPQAPADSVDPSDVPAAELPLFQSHDVLHMRLVADLKTVFKERGDKPEEFPAELSVTLPSGATEHYRIEVRTRGNFRLKKRTCDFPPIRLDFPKDSVVGMLFAGQDKLKLVTHCRSKSDDFEQSVLQEYLIYRTYNLLTDASFRVRPARITYVDTGRDNDSLTKYAFIIEREDHLAERHGMMLLERPIHPHDMDPHVASVLGVFQYMIGNTDWSAAYQHNCKLMMGSTQVPVPIPYDFDWAGVISAPYARPDASLPIRTVRERLFRGFCRSDEFYRQAFDLLNRQKEEIYALYRSQEGLTEKSRNQAVEYYEEFYKIINDPRRARREIIESCRQAGG